MKLENWARVRISCRDGVIALTQEIDNQANNYDNTGYYVAIIGEIYGSRFDKEGEQVHTMAIRRSSDEMVETNAGSVFELGEKHPDFIAFEKAISDGISILERWAIGYFKGGSTELYIHGHIRGEERWIHKKIVGQEGPVIICDDGTKVFVDWIAAAPFQKYKLYKEIKLKNVKAREFCGNAGFEPDIFASNWIVAHG